MSATPASAPVTSAAPANAAPVTVACPACNCPSCPKCPDCGAPKAVVVEEDKGSSSFLSSPLFMYIAIAAGLYFFLFYTQTGRNLAQQYIPSNIQAAIAPSAPPYRY